MALFPFVLLSWTMVMSYSAKTNPNILFIMVDDLGWGNVGYHNKENKQIKTPNIDNLVANGLELNRHYVFSGCSPTRSSFQSGRLPVHVTTMNDDGMDDPSHGAPVEMTLIASKFKEAKYSTYLVGKWDVGFATWDNIPVNRGYDYFYGYLSKALNYYNKEGEDDCPDDVDLWENNGPAHFTKDDIDTTEYVEFALKKHVLEIIDGYGMIPKDKRQQQPFFMMYSSHLPHFPSMVPKEYLMEDIYGDDENMCATNNDYIYPGFTDGDLFQCRTTFQSQVNLLDIIVGEIVEKLKETNLWKDTLLIFTSDNGGDLAVDSTSSTNYPLRGGKSTEFEGGIRAVSFVSGGYLPKKRRGDVEHGMIHIADWYTTFCALLGIDATDHSAIENGLPDVDGYDMWPLISGKTKTSPRTEYPVTEYMIISGEYKLITGVSVPYAIFQGWMFPNSSTQSEDALYNTDLDCGNIACLFNVVDDIGEYNNIAADNPDIVHVLTTRLEELKQHFYQNDIRGTDSCPDGFTEGDNSLSCGCWMAVNNYNYFIGPYQDLTPDQIHFAENDYISNNKQGIIMRVLDKEYIYNICIVIMFICMIILIKYLKPKRYKPQHTYSYQSV